MTREYRTSRLPGWAPLRPREHDVARLGVNPKQYLREAARRAIATPGAVTLPRELLAE